MIVGASGKVGRAWMRMGGSDAKAAPGGDLSDSTGRTAVLDAMTGLKPSVVVLAAAETRVDVCESNPEQAKKINVDSMQELTVGAARMGSGVIFYSSDYVFDGTGPCRETDKTAPLNVYGQSKVDAENAIIASGAEHLIIRINVPLAPPADGHSFYSFVADNLKAGKEIRVVTDQWSNPLDTDRIAQWSWEAWQQGVRGILHLAGGTYATRYDIARMIAEYIGADVPLIKPCLTEELSQQASRPFRGGLLIEKQADLFGTAPDLPTILTALPK